MRPVELEFLMKDGITTGLDKIKSYTDSVKSKASLTAVEFEELQKYVMVVHNKITMLESQLENFRLVAQNAFPDLNQNENIQQIETLENHIEELEKELQQLQNISENVNVVPPELPNAHKKFNGLHNSIQQMAREMPSLAVGPQTFFLAISNNLPIFADEVKRAKEEYADLIRQGEKGVPVWKQILKSLFSWQTALTTGIMLLTMYGDEIIQWAKDLIGAKSEVDELRKAMELKNEVEKEAHAISIRTRAELNNVIQDLKSFTGTKEQEKSKIEELNRKYGDTFGYYETLAEWYDILIQKGEDYIEMLLLQAKAQSYIDKAVNVDEQINNVESKGKEEFRPMWGEGGKVNMFFGGDNLDHYGSDPAELAFRAEKQKLEDEKAQYIKDAEKLFNDYINKSKESGLNDYKPVSTDGKDESEKLQYDLEKEQKDASKERQELEKELYFQEQQNRINLETNERKRKEAQMKLDHEKELYNLEQQKQSFIDAEIKRQKAIFDAVENAKASKDDKYVKKTFSEADIDKTEIDKITEYYNNLYEQIEKIQQKERDEINNEEEKAQNEYLSKYGGFLEKMEAITKLYAEKIRKAATEGERKTLEAERDAAIKAIEKEMSGNNINWDNIFADVSRRSVESLKAMRDEIRKVILEGKDLSASDMSRLYEQYNKVGDAIEEGSFSLKKLMGYTNEDVEHAKRLKEEYEELKGIYEELVRLQQEHKTAAENANSDLVNFMKQNTGQDITGQESEQTMVEMLQENGATEETMSAFDKLYSKNEEASKQLANTTKNVQGAGEAMGKAGAAMQGAGGSAASTIAFIDKIIHMVNDNVQSAVGVMEELGLEDTKAGKFTEKFAESSQYATQAWESLKSGNIMGVVHGVLGSLRTLGEGLGQLGIAGFGSNNADLPEQLENLSRSNDNLKQSVDKLSGIMEDASAKEAAELYQQQQDNLNATISGTQDMMGTAANTYSNGFLGIGGEHSADYFINEAMNSTDWARMTQILKENGFDSTINGAGDLWNLSPEEMEAIASFAPDLWTKLQNAISEGYAGEELIQLMNDYIGLAGQANELTDEYKDKITGISFDGVRDNFKNALLDMDMTADKMGENIGETLLNGIVENMMSGEYNDRLQEWYDEFAEAMVDGVLSDDEREYLNSLYTGIAEDAIAERDALMEAAGIDPDSISQTGKQGGFNAMSQEQGTKLEGLFVSAQMHLTSIDERQEDVAETMSVAVGHLRKIEENTGDCKDSLEEINQNIKTIIRDGVKAI